MKALLGFVGYYRCFFKDFATLARPLNGLTSNWEEFVWGEVQQRAFSTLQAMMVEVLALACPEASKEYLLDTDTSADGVGEALSQCLEEYDQVVAYFNKIFSVCQRNYCVTRRELLAVMLAGAHLRAYLFG